MVTYRPGSKNIKVDTLSRQHEFALSPPTNEPILLSTLILAPVQWDLMTEIADAQSSESPPPDCPPNCNYVPVALRRRVTQWVHNSPSSDHPGITTTMQLVSNRF